MPPRLPLVKLLYVSVLVTVELPHQYIPSVFSLYSHNVPMRELLMLQHRQYSNEMFYYLKGNIMFWPGLR